jgi:predicted protein tyrosine phosphatase
MNLLFVCSRNRLRSPTAEAIFSTYKGLEVESAGLNPDAEIVLSGELNAFTPHVSFSRPYPEFTLRTSVK